VSVYGSAYAEHKIDFIAELHDVMAATDKPTLVCGDFNLVRGPKEKSNERVNSHHTLLFNDWINRWHLIEFKPANRAFTWANNQQNPILAALDKVFATTDWELHFPLSSVQALSRAVSDHTPLIIDTGQNLPPPQKLFRFEKWWLDKPDFDDLVKFTWALPCPGASAIDIWQFKLRALRKKN
jgi:hypothetical protein